MKILHNTKEKYEPRSIEHKKDKFLALISHGRMFPWDRDRQDGFTHGEHASREAEDPSDYSVDQFINTDDDNDDDSDEEKHSFVRNHQPGGTTDNFSEDEVADDDN